MHPLPLLKERPLLKLLLCTCSLGYDICNEVMKQLLVGFFCNATSAVMGSVRSVFKSDIHVIGQRHLS